MQSSKTIMPQKIWCGLSQSSYIYLELYAHFHNGNCKILTPRSFINIRYVPYHRHLPHWELARWQNRKQNQKININPETEHSIMKTKTLYTLRDRTLLISMQKVIQTRPACMPFFGDMSDIEMYTTYTEYKKLCN